MRGRMARKRFASPAVSGRLAAPVQPAPSNGATIQAPHAPGDKDVECPVFPFRHAAAYSGTRNFDKSGVACYAPPACIRLPQQPQHGGLPCPENVELLRRASRALALRPLSVAGRTRDAWLREKGFWPSFSPREGRERSVLASVQRTVPTQGRACLPRPMPAERLKKVSVFCLAK